MIAQSNDAVTVRADQLAESDIIRHSTGEAWLVISEPEYTNNGISFDILCLDVPAPDNTQTVCFAPEVSFLLLEIQAAPKSVNPVAS